MLTATPIPIPTARIVSADRRFRKRRSGCFAGTKVSGRPRATHTMAIAARSRIVDLYGAWGRSNRAAALCTITAEADFLCLRRYPAGNCRIALPGWTLVAQGQV